MGEVRVTEEASGRDRITEVRIQGMRALADVRLPLGGLTVLIGENGSGKSTIIEALELARRASLQGRFVDQLPLHGGLDALLRAGESTLRIGVRIDGSRGRIDYEFALTKPWSSATSAIVSEERLDWWQERDTAEPRRMFLRHADTCKLFDPEIDKSIDRRIDPGELALWDVHMRNGRVPESPLARVINVLGTGRAHVPFDVRAGWIAARPSAMRLPAQLAVADEVERLGGNLANCYHKLLSGSREVRERTLERVRVGLGPEVVDVRTPAVGPTLIDLVIDFRGLSQPVSALTLSDGQLAYLAFVALAELGKNHGYVAFDEPEDHLHPGLLVRVVWMLEELAESCPVILATQSDQLLDALHEPAKSVVLCELDETRSTQLFRPDPDVRKKWLERYRGLGELRAEGFAPHVFSEPLEPGK